jgi:di/tricarboxylate transporter
MEAHLEDNTVAEYITIPEEPATLLMPWEAWVTLAVVVIVLWVLARNLAAPDVALIGAMTVLVSCSIASDRFPSAREAAAAFGNEGLLTIGVLFVVAAGLTETGALAGLTDRLLGRPRSITAAQIRLMLPVAAASAFVNNTPVVAMFVPVVRDWCRRTGLNPSKIYIPLSYAAVLGGVCTLIGTSTNLVVQGLLLDAQRTNPSIPSFGMFTLTGVGVPVAIGGVLFIALTSRWLLPERTAPEPTEGDPRQYTVEMLVQRGSSVVNRSVEEAGLRHLPGMYLAEIERNGQTLVAVGPTEILRAEDRLVFVGVVDSVVDIQRIRGLVPATDQVFKLEAPRHNRCLVEAVVSEASPLVGRSIRDGRFRTRYGAVVIAVHRNGQRINRKVGDIVLRPGDALLLETHPFFVSTYRNNPEFFLVSGVEDSNPRRHDRAGVAVAILLAMVGAAALEPISRLSLFTAALLAASAMLLTGCVSTQRARRSLAWDTLAAIGASLVVGRTIETSGLAGGVSGGLVQLFNPYGAWAVLAAVYFLTLVATEFITNNAAAAMMVPIALGTSAELGVNPLPFAVVVAIAASSGFATPLGYQTHLLVYGAGGYRFSDFVRLGIPLDVLVMVITLLITPLLFPF